MDLKKSLYMFNLHSQYFFSNLSCGMKAMFCLSDDVFFRHQVSLTFFSLKKKINVTAYLSYLFFYRKNVLSYTFLVITIVLFLFFFAQILRMSSAFILIKIFDFLIILLLSIILLNRLQVRLLIE